jgi:hypothetical protein
MEKESLKRRKKKKSIQGENLLPVFLNASHLAVRGGKSFSLSFDEAGQYDDKDFKWLKKLNNMKEENSNPSIRYNATTSYRPNVLYIGTPPPLEIKKYERRRLK